MREFAARRLADFKLFRSRSRVARHVMADHVKCYKRALLEAGLKPTTPWRLVKKYCRAVGIDLDRPGSRGIGIHSLRFVRKEEDAEVAARRIHIRVTGRKGE